LFLPDHHDTNANLAWLATVIRVTGEDMPHDREIINEADLLVLQINGQEV
jgi:hypothetical protein